MASKKKSVKKKSVMIKGLAEKVCATPLSPEEIKNQEKRRRANDLEPLLIDIGIPVHDKGWGILWGTVNSTFVLDLLEDEKFYKKILKEFKRRMSLKAFW